MKTEVRIDKWIWAMRLYKTRSIATEACKKGRVMLGDRVLKPAHCIKVGDVIKVNRPPVVYSFKVLQLTENRLGAKLVPLYMENVTPREQYEILEMTKASGFINRQKGTGRPTKKERRDLDDFMEESFIYDQDFDDEGWDEI